jgi:enoyl-[acyl-carrier protein] reductase III
MATLVTLGPIDTAEFRTMFPTNYRERLEAPATAKPSGRGVTVDDTADAVWQIAQPSMSMVQRQTITVDGDLSL